MRFLEDYFPERWARISRCGLGRPATHEDRLEPGRYKVALNSWHQIPYCIRCVQAEARRRTWTTLNNLHRCTPGGEPTRLVHIVQTAPIYDDGTGWGVARRTSRRSRPWCGTRSGSFYGEGIGAVLSYQDFGERGFGKRHPHLDLTLNGWRLVDGKPEQTPTLNLTHGGRERWDAAIIRRAQNLDPAAARGNLDVSRPSSATATTTGS